jgi:predicted small metal-binding protein
MPRKVMDCRDMPSERGCTLTIAGEEDEVLRAAVQHAVDAHGHRDTPEFREALRHVLKADASGTVR